MLAWNQNLETMAEINTQTKNEEEKKKLLDRLLKEAFGYMLFLLKIK